MSCIIRGCRSNPSRKQNESSEEVLTFHRFPREEVKRNEWIKRIGRPHHWTPKNHTRICSKHFTLDSFVCIQDLKWRRLREDAVPTLFIRDASDEMESKTHLVVRDERCIRILHKIQESPQNSPPQSVMTKKEIDNFVRIRKLEEKLERSEKISKRRLRKVNTLTKQVSRLAKKNQDLYNILRNRLVLEHMDEEDIETEDKETENIETEDIRTEDVETVYTETEYLEPEFIT